MEDNTPPSKENYSVALSGLIMGVVSLICAWIPSWRGFAVVLGVAALLVCFFSLSRASKVHSKRSRAIVGIVLAVLGIAVAVYFKFGSQPVSGEQNHEKAVPVELLDSGALEQDHTRALDKLHNITDTANAQ